MYNLKFDSLKSAMELNKLTEKELVLLLQRNLANLNYRENYNKEKNILLKDLKNDPVVRARMEALKKAK